MTDQAQAAKPQPGLKVLAESAHSVVFQEEAVPPPVDKYRKVFTTLVGEGRNGHRGDIVPRHRNYEP